MAISGWMDRRSGGVVLARRRGQRPRGVLAVCRYRSELTDPSGAYRPRHVARALFGARRAIRSWCRRLHVITNPVVHAGVDQLLVEAPAHLRVVVASRHDPPLSLSPRAQGALRAALRRPPLRIRGGRCDAARSHRRGAGRGGSPGSRSGPTDGRPRCSWLGCRCAPRGRRERGRHVHRRQPPHRRLPHRRGARPVARSPAGLHPCHGVPRPADGATLRGRRGRR